RVRALETARRAPAKLDAATAPSLRSRRAASLAGRGKRGCPMVDTTVKHILETEIPDLLKRRPEMAKDINPVIHFNTPGERGRSWTMDLTKAADWVTGGALGTPKMTVTVSDQDFVKIRQKQLNAQMAAMQGKLKFKPMDMGLAMKLGKLLS